MNKMIWRLRQLLPLTYRTEYRDEQGARHFCVWNMWMGRSFNISDVIVSEL